MGISVQCEEDIDLLEQTVDTDLAFELVHRLLIQVNKKEKNRERSLQSLLDSCVPEEGRIIRFEDELKLIQQLKQLSDRLSTKSHVDLLSKYCVVGLCGGFSAGKSGFANTILGDYYLPEDVSPTTAIPTYVVYGDTEIIWAYLHNGSIYQLSRELLQAMSHAFEEQYHIAFSAIIDSIVLQTPRMTYRNLMILDTPGYSAAQGDRKQNQKDASKAIQALQEADGIICLVNVNNGDLTTDDLYFLKNLNSKAQPLFVVTKRDLKSDADARQVCQKVRDTAEREGLNPVAVTAFTTQEEEHELDGTTLCLDYLKAMENTSKGSAPFAKQVFDVLDEIIQNVDSRITTLTKGQSELIQALRQYPAPLRAAGLVQYIANYEQEIQDMKVYAASIRKKETLSKQDWSESAFENERKFLKSYGKLAASTRK